jgi:DNA-binding NarL/FixJ family response regulator
MHFSPTYISEFLTAGAAGFLPKNCTGEKLINAVLSVYNHGHYYDDTVSKLVSELVKNKKAVPALDHARLTPREIDILRLICSEKSTLEIGELLRISVRTVEWHKQNIFEKTYSKTLAGLTIYAIRTGIIPNPEDLYN